MDTDPVVVIVGCGVFGLSTALELCRLKKKVIVVDQYDFCDFHNNSSDLNRVVRSDYGDDKIFTKYAKESIDIIKQWNDESISKYKNPFYYQVGMLALFKDKELDPQSFFNQQLKILKEKYPNDKDIKLHTIDQIGKQFPIFRREYCIKKEKITHFYQSGTISKYGNGYVNSRKVLQFMKNKCIELNKNNIKFYFNTKIDSIVINKNNCDSITLQQQQETATHAQSHNNNKYIKVNNIDKLIFCTGAWTNSTLKSLNLPIFPYFQVEPNIVGYFKVKNDDEIKNMQQEEGDHDGTDTKKSIEKLLSAPYFAPFLADLEKTGFYIMPLEFDNECNEYLLRVTNEMKSQLTPIYDEKTRQPDSKTVLKYFNSIKYDKILPFFDYLSLVKFKVCLYNNTNDQSFLIDYIPNSNNIIVASGGSGHGFKFAAILGKLIVAVSQNRLHIIDEKAKEKFAWKPRMKSDGFYRVAQDQQEQEKTKSKL